MRSIQRGATSTRALPTFVVLGLVGLAGCGAASQAEVVDSDQARHTIAVEQASGVPDVVGATDRLGMDLLALTPAENNAVTSPASAVVALAMLGEGARGVTAEELDALLGASGPERTDAVNALTGELASLDGDPAVVQEDELPETPLVHVANNVVVDDDAEILAEYLDTLAVGYGASVQSTDLGGADGKAVLDTWVDEHTGGLIEESAIVPTADTRLVLQNAVLLAARWDAPFEVADTRPRPFDVAGESVEVDTMAVTEPFGYAEVDGWQAVRLPYTGGELHTDVILPPQGSSPADLDTDLLGRIQVGLAEVEPRPVELHLPKVDLETKADLLTLLEERAPSLVAEADLSGMSPSGLFVSQAAQQATLTVDEEGTVAAAVTEIAGDESAAQPPDDLVQMHVDRPFVIRIAHTPTDWSLFLARIADPRG